MLSYKVKIGLAPMRRDRPQRPPKTFLAWESAEERGHRFVKYIEDNFTSEHVEFVNINGIGCNDLMFDDASAEAVIERFQKEKVDAVIVINGNFGNEEIVADIAKALGSRFAYGHHLMMNIMYTEKDQQTPNVVFLAFPDNCNVLVFRSHIFHAAEWNQTSSKKPLKDLHV